MTTAAWIILTVLFIWIVILQSKTSDLNNKIEFLTNRLKGVEKYLSTRFVENEHVIEHAKPIEEPAKPIEEPVNNDEYIDDVGIIKNKPVEEEKTTVVYNYVNNQKNEDFEHVFLGKVSSIIGAVAVIIGFAIFIGIIQGALSPMFKAIFALCVGTGIVACGLCIKKESLLKYSEALIGTGFAVIFITIYCATMVTQTFSVPSCVVLGIIALVSAYIVANKQKTISMIAIALIGGYLNVFMVSKNVDLNNLFIYLIFLNILSMAFVAKNADKNIINYVNLILTFLFSISFMLVNDSRLSIIYPLILWGIYLVYDVLMKEKSEEYNKDNYFHWVNYVIASLFSVFIFREDVMRTGLNQLYLAIPYCLITGIYIARNSEKYLMHLNTLLFCILAAINLIASGCTRVGLLSLGAIIIAIIANKYEKEYLAKWSTGFLIAAVITAFIFNKDMFYWFDASDYKPVFNLRTLALASTILASFVCCFEFKESKSEIFHNLSQYMKLCGITLLYILFSFEIGDYIQYVTKEKADALFISSMTYSIICCIYSVQMKKLYSVTKLPAFNLLFYIAGVFALCILLTEGLKFSPIESFIPVFNLRFIAFLTAIAISAYISKSEKTDVYKYIALALGFILITVETSDFIKYIDTSNMNYLISIMWIIYSGIILVIGIFKNKKCFKMAGIWIVILTVLKILFVDMAQVNFIYKMIVFMLLGAVLMIISYYYNKLQK